MRKIHIVGARENNLQNISIEIPPHHLTVVTGVSGSGKSSLVFDTLYHEARRRFLEIFSLDSAVRLAPAAVDHISGLGPAVAVGQNLLNRNPLSTLATASGLHPFFRLLYSNFGVQNCPVCGTGISVLTEDEIIDTIIKRAKEAPVTVFAPVLHQVQGSHRTLLELLATEFGNDVIVDGRPWDFSPLNPRIPHDITVRIAELSQDISAKDVRALIHQVFALGCQSVVIESEKRKEVFSRVSVCINCGAWVKHAEPKHFHTVCSHCNGEGCFHCQNTGLHPEAAAVTWHGKSLFDLMKLSVDEALHLFRHADLPESARRLETEIKRRLEALQRVGLGYITLSRPSPTVSRGEAQRVRLAVLLTSRLEDMQHVLDEPTIGQHPFDTARLLPAFRELAGPVIFVEHDRMAAAAADYAIDLGPGAGHEGGKVIFAGRPSELWEADTPTGRYFSFREKVKTPLHRKKPLRFLTFKGVHLHNLKNIDVPIPIGRLTLLTGVSGSGKSTFLEVLVDSLKEKTPSGCQKIEGTMLKPVLVDQSPIGRNPRSNPATYTKLSDIIRDLFASATRLSPSHFSFNRPEGACPLCKGMGAIEVEMRYLPSTWITCERCEGKRFSDEVLSRKVAFKERLLSIADFYELSIEEAAHLLSEDRRIPPKKREAARRIIKALIEVGLHYLSLGQPSPTLSGGEAQRVKLAKYLGKRSLRDNLLVLDEPSTGLHPQDISGLLTVLDRLVSAGATVLVVEHNTDIIRAADWVIDLGPGAGPEGGEIVCVGTPKEVMEEERSLTGKALKNEMILLPEEREAHYSDKISIRNAEAHNLKRIRVDIPKNSLTVVTGVSGSGKSSLVSDVLEAEARRRFLESLSMYERQSTREGPEAPVESVSGLGVAVAVSPSKGRYSRRSTVGTDTEILHHLTVILAYLGSRLCLECGSEMVRKEEWVCPHCGSQAEIASPQAFIYSNWHSVCPRCQGVGTILVPNPEKLIIHPEKPLCGGAMYSPGFFPKGYLCKPFNYGYSIIRALAEKYDFDPETTPWKDMSPEAQHAFLFGDAEPLRVSHANRQGQTRTGLLRCPGFYGWVRDWDVGGTYTEAQPCPECKGGQLRPEFLAVRLKNYNIHELSELPLSELEKILKNVSGPALQSICRPNFETALKRLHFLLKVGLGYLHLNRVSATLSAGEAERVKLAGILGSNLTSLTVLLDEPSRGLHPSEVDSLVETLKELRDEENTVIVVEHDPVIIRAADYIVDMGPGAGVRGGTIVAEGTFEEVVTSDSLTGKWLRGERRMRVNLRRPAQGWMTIRGAKENNLKGEDVSLPLGVLVGVCGVSGSGKSTLIVDTLGRALAPTKQTTSVAYEPVAPGAHDTIENASGRVVLVDQTRKGIHNPGSYLRLVQPLQRIYAESEDAKALGISAKQLSHQCSVCRGSGFIRIDMGFLPAVHTFCDACEGTGYPPEAWEVKVKGVSLPQVGTLTMDEVLDLFREHEISRPLKAAHDVGLGYLVLHQPGYTLSGGEAERLKIASELCSKTPEGSLYVLDEPTVGLHLEDVDQLLRVLHHLVDAGHSVIVIEHNPYVLAACDWLIEMGPGGGPEGGYIIASGTPEHVVQKGTPTSAYLKEVLEGRL